MDKIKRKTTKRSERTIEELMEQAFQAQAEYEYAKAIELYSQALADEEITAETAYEALDQRAECYDRVGQFSGERDDLDKMVAIAQELSSPEMQVSVVFRRISLAERMGENEKVKQIAESAKDLAQEINEDSIRAGASLAMGYYYFVWERYSEALDNLEKALRLYRATGDSKGEANSLFALSGVNLHSGQQTLAGKYALDALAIWRALGDRRREASALNAWALTISDYAQGIDAKEEALEIFKEIGDRWGQGQMYNNLGLLYGQMGLYSTARDYAEQAVEMVREIGARRGLELYLDSLARAEMNMRDYEKSRGTFKECMELTRELSHRTGEAFIMMGLGRVALASGNSGEARNLIHGSLDIFRENKKSKDLPTVLAWLGAAYLALDEPKPARRYTAEAVTEQEAIGYGGSEYPPQEVWWWHYLALTHELRQDQTYKGNDVLEIPENAFSALQKARQITYEGIASLSDEGLRRNYLNKVAINRQIITEWAHQAAARDLSIEGEEAPPGNVQAQLQRQLAIGVRMNERREVEALIDFIMDELIELSGAERAMLVLVDESGEQSVASSYGFLEKDEGEFLKQAENLLKSVETARMHALRQDVHQGDIDATTDNPFEALSVLCVPLLSKGKLSGFIYADNHAIFGNFTQADVDLLAAFANQIVSSIVNAELYEGLEQKVIERTTELSASNQALEQRNAELAVINSVQEGLAAKMEFDAIIELVGEKIRQVFDAQGINIALYDRKFNLVSLPYFVDDEQRITMESTSQPFGFTGHIIETAQPLLVNRNLIQKMEDLGSKWIGDEENNRLSKSYLGVPILIAGEVIGVISLINYDREDAYSVSDVNLLSTLAASMSVALENARLFDETNQRAADLAVINEIQQGLAAKLDFDGIIELVGDKLIEIFKAHELGIILYETETDLTHWSYAFYQGERRFVDPMPPGGFSGHVLKTGKKVVVNERIDQAMEEYDSKMVMDGVDKPKSVAFVPINSEGKVIGVIALSNVEKENAFDESSVGLVESIAASLGIALSNVRLFEETTQRAADLAVINEVQQGLSEQLEFQTIVDLVGDKLLSIFKTQNLFIVHYDAETDLCHWPYASFQGERHSIDPMSPGGFSGHVIKTGKSVVVNRDMLETAKEFDSELLVEDVDVPKSIAYVPIMAEGKVIGVIGLSDTEREDAYDAASIRLVESLAGSLGIALSNVGLFEETKQRAAELAIINSVQEGLASQLDMQAVFDLVGDQIKEIFDAQAVIITTYDRQAKMNYPRYVSEKGERFYPDSIPQTDTAEYLIRTRKPLLIRDSLKKRIEELGITMKIVQGTEIPKSLLFVPLIIGGEVQGHVSLQNVDREGAFNDSDQRLLSTLANSMSAALENARLFEETNQRAAELSVINSVQEGLAAELDMQAIYDLVGDNLREVFVGNGVAISIFDHERSLENIAYVFERGERFYPQPETISKAAHYFIESRKPIKYDTIEEIFEIGAKIVEGTEAEKSGMWAPLISGETVRGQLAVFSHDEEYAFTEDDLRLLTTLANSMSVALENARLFDETNRRAADLAVINEVQQGLSEKLEFQAIIDLVGDKLMSIFKTQNLSIVIYDAETELSHWPYTNWLGKKRSIDPTPLGGFSGHVIKTGKSLVINEGMEAAAKKFDSFLLDEDIVWPKSIAYVPIISEGKSIGMIGVSDAERENAYDAASVRLIESLASSLGIALSNVRLFEEINQRAAELALVNQVQEGLAAELDMQAIYDLVGDTLREVFKTEGASVTIYDLERGLDYCTYLYEEGERIYLEPNEIGEASQEFIKNRKPFKYDTLEEIEKIGGKILEGTKAEKSGMWVPLLVGETVKGKLSVLNHEREYAYAESDLRLLTTLANSMSVSLENARLFEETNQRAAELAVINSVQEGLAAELDMQAIYDLVGEKIRHVFNAQGVAISIYDHERGYINIPYAYELGERLSVDPFAINEPHKKFIQDHKPLMFNSVKEYKDFGAKLVKGTKQDQSGMWVPLMVGETVKGRINVFNLEEEHAFDDADLNLLTTLANSMSVSLENARLFEETNQRAAELALINSVQQGLAAELDMQAIYDMVGDQIRDVFDAQAVMIVTYDYVNELTNIRYMVEKGERIFPSPIPISPLNKHLIKNRQPLLMETSQDFADYSSTLIDGTEYPKSGIFVPLTIGDSVRGSITLQNFDRESAYGEPDVGLLSTLANSMSVALENARLFDETNQRAAELAIINSVGEAMAKQLDVETIARIVGDKVRDIFDSEVTDINLYDQESGLVRRVFAYDRGYLEASEFPYGEGLTSKVIQSKRPLVIGSLQEATDQGAVLHPNAIGDEKEVESYMGVPIIVGEQVIGVVDVQSYRLNAFDDDSVRLLSTLAANMGVALENARLFQETTRRANETAALNDIGREISATLDQNVVLEQIANRAKEILNAKDVVLRLVRSNGSLPTVVALGKNADYFRKSVLKIGEGITGNVAETGIAEVIASSQADARGTHVAGTDEQEDDTIIFAPLKVRERVIGVMGLWRDNEVAGPFGDTDLSFAVGLARQAAIAIENARLFTEAEQRASEMTALAELGQDISATLDLPTVLERISTRAQDLLNARTAVIRLVGEDGSMPTVVAIGKYAEKHRGTMIQIGEGITGTVAKTGRAEIINDPWQDNRLVHVPGTPQEEDELEAIIFAPLMIGERVIGVMGLWRDKPVAGPFSKDDLNFLQSLARQAANAIENARLFQEVQRQKQYSEALLQNSPVAIMTTDLDNMVVSWNPAAENLFGYPASEAIGVNISDLISNESVEEEMSGIYEQLKRGERVNTVTQRFRKDGSPVDVELLSLPVVMDGKKVGLIAIYHDITELLKARHEAEAANEAKSAFLATMSHEIRTPMNAIIGMTGLLLDTQLDAEQIDFTETIRDSGDTLLTIINDILDFSKIEAGKMELEKQPFDLRDCVESALDLLKVKAADKEIELAYLVEENVPEAIIGDVTRLRQILINLISNALKFTEQGEVVLSVRTGADGQHEKKHKLQKLEFSVRDTGIGIPPERMDRLFLAFSQVDTSTSRKYGGTGLGLAISKRLAEMMGGEMWVESEVGKGTTFHFTIQTMQAPEVKKRPHLSGEQAELSGKRLLVVDDNATNRRILTLQGKSWGMHVRTTESPQEALSWVKKGDPFDLAILDMNMQGMTGIELAVAIRELQSADVLPLVLFTSLGSREVETEGIEFVAQLQKPLKPSVLFEILMEIFAGQGMVEVKEKPEKPIKDPNMGERHPLRILLAEDNVVNQKLALKLLSQMGYRADVAGNGLEAIQAIERQTYDLVLMDVQMPEMDGLEASRQICSRWPRSERPRIVAMTANAMQGDRERCLEAGMDDYVGKPVRVEELISALDRTPTLN